MIALEVHHGEEHVHNAQLEPTLCILENGGVGRPSSSRVAGHIIVFAYRRAADAHPGFKLLDGVINLLDNCSYVLASPVGFAHPIAIYLIGIAVRKRAGILRITYIIEVDAVHIVVLNNLVAKTFQIVCCARQSWVEIVRVAMLLE